MPCVNSLPRRLRAFAMQESGAITMDWTTMTAGLVGLGLSSVAAVSTGTGSMGVSIQSTLTNAFVAGSNRIANGGFDPAGFSFGYRHYYNYTNTLNGWNVLSPEGERVDIVPSDYYGFTNALLGPDEYLVDTVGRPGDRLDFGQPVTLAEGEQATLRFNAGTVVTQHRTNVYWGGELIATLDSENTPRNTLTAFEIPITGGGGDGTNQLRFETVDGTGYGGTLLHDIRVH